MNKTRGCFIIFVIIFLIAAIFIVLFIQKTPNKKTEPALTNTEDKSNNAESLDSKEDLNLDLSINNVYKDNSED